MTDLFVNESRSWFIPHNVASLKNSRRPVTLETKIGKRPYTTLIPSKPALSYQKLTDGYWKAYRAGFRQATESLERPLIIEFKFLRSTRRKFDYTNALDMVQDMMVKHGWIDDDNAEELLPVILPYDHNPNGPGVWIRISQVNTAQPKPNRISCEKQ